MLGRSSPTPHCDAAILLLPMEDVRLLVTDIDLPGTLDGIALARAIRERAPSIPVVFISGRPSKLQDARTVGDPSAFLQQPFSLIRLLADVQRLAAIDQKCQPTPRRI
jgi:CheY-like chemotaxis protein